MGLLDLIKNADQKDLKELAERYGLGGANKAPNSLIDALPSAPSYGETYTLRPSQIEERIRKRFGTGEITPEGVDPLETYKGTEWYNNPDFGYGDPIGANGEPVGMMRDPIRERFYKGLPMNPTQREIDEYRKELMQPQTVFRPMGGFR